MPEAEPSLLPSVSCYACRYHGFRSCPRSLRCEHMLALGLRYLRHLGMQFKTCGARSLHVSFIGISSFVTFHTLAGLVPCRNSCNCVPHLSFFWGFRLRSAEPASVIGLNGLWGFLLLLSVKSPCPPSSDLLHSHKTPYQRHWLLLIPLPVD